MSCENMTNHMFLGASNVAISGGTFINQSHSQTSTFDKLSAATASSALHDAPARTDATRCHRYTRVNVLDHLERWAQGILEGGPSVFWLHGGAGAGKSAIMQTLAERCAAQGLVLGSFFFSRTDPTRNIAGVLIPTLAYQVAQSFPSTLLVLGPVVDRDPLIFKKSLQVQLLGLLVHPLKHLLQLGSISNAPRSPSVFLIDGLDECDEPAQQQRIIQMIATVCHEHCIPVKFLIASRPEPRISTSFELYEESFVLGAISLSEDPDADDDIRAFIKAEFFSICQQHCFKKMIPSGWPCIYDVNKLVEKSSSHFIYASTVMRHIWSAVENPVRSLQVVLGLEVSRTVAPFSELDALYRHILQSAAHLGKVLQILAFCVCTNLPPLVSMICIMLDYSKDDFRIFMADMSPLVAISESAKAYTHGEEEVKLLHASLGDFLCDKARSGSLYVDKEVYLASSLERCNQLLDMYSRNQHTVPDWPLQPPFLTETPYEMLFHLVIATITTTGHLAITQEFLRRWSLRDFHECQKRFQNIDQRMSASEMRDELFMFLCAVHSIGTAGDVSLFRHQIEEFFDILEAYIGSEGIPIAPAILPLIFLGSPTQTVHDILLYHCHGGPLYDFLACPFSNPFQHGAQETLTILDLISATDLASIRHSANTSPQCLAAAADAILEYIFDHTNLFHLPTHTAHKSWLQETKPGKPISTGTPRLASVFHEQSLSSFFRLEHSNHTDALRLFESGSRSQLHNLTKGLRLKYRLSPSRLQRLQDKLRIIRGLLDVLPQVLSKAGFSEKIILYSKKCFSRALYQREAGRIRRLHNCLDEYNTRIHNEKLQEPREKSENGDANTLVEKSRVLNLDAQD